MKKEEYDILKFKAVLLIDSLFSLYIFTIIVFTLIPLLSNFNHTLKKEYQIIEIKQMITSSINHYDKKTISKGISLGDYYIKLSSNTICGLHKKTKIKSCVKY